MLVAIYNMSKMKLIMERWKRAEKTLTEDHCFQRDTPAYGRDEWSFMDALNEPAMDRDEQTAGPMTLPTGEAAGERTLVAPQAQMTYASEEDLVDNFDDAFGLARRKGRVFFDYGGKEYTTQLDTETDIDWAENLGMSLWDLHSYTGKVRAMPGGGRGPGLKRHLAQQPNPEAPGGYDAPGRTPAEMEREYKKQYRKD